MLSDTLPGTVEGPQRVLISAGAAGLGRAVAERFHAAGAHVHVGDDSAENVVQLLADLPGIHATVTDVSRLDEVETLVDEARDWMGGVDVLVNCASEVGASGGLQEIEPDQWSRALSLNLTSAFHGIRAVAPLMKEQMGGVVINLGPHAGSGLPRQAPYAAAKSGLEGLTKSAAREMGPYGVRCNSVLPGLVDDEVGRQRLQEWAAAEGVSKSEAESELLANVSMRTWIAPSEVADLVYFLASPAARTISGQAVAVCGDLRLD